MDSVLLNLEVCFLANFFLCVQKYGAIITSVKSVSTAAGRTIIFRFFFGMGGERVGKVAFDDQFHLSTRSINKMLKALRLRGRKMADIGALCIVAQMLDAGSSPRTSEFTQLLGDFGFMVDKVALRQVFLLLLLFPSLIVTPTVPHIPSCTTDAT